LRNQPKYNLFKNTSYALAGLKDILEHESSFKIEIILSIILIPFILYIDATIIEKSLLFITLMGVLIAETINSSIERVVDLVTLEHHEMAKRAKDVGSTIVFLSISLFVIIWANLLYNIFL